MFNAYMNKSVTLRRSYGNNTWGERLYTDTIVKARVEFKNKMIRDYRGEMVVSSASVLLPDLSIDVSDKIIIDGVVHPILMLTKQAAFINNSMQEAFLG